jgi:hypothetical protein
MLRIGDLDVDETKTSTKRTLTVRNQQKFVPKIIFSSTKSPKK